MGSLPHRIAVPLPIKTVPLNLLFCRGYDHFIPIKIEIDNEFWKLLSVQFLTCSQVRTMNPTTLFVRGAVARWRTEGRSL